MAGGETKKRGTVVDVEEVCGTGCEACGVLEVVREAEGRH